MRLASNLENYFVVQKCEFFVRKSGDLPETYERASENYERHSGERGVHLSDMHPELSGGLNCTPNARFCWVGETSAAYCYGSQAVFTRIRSHCVAAAVCDAGVRKIAAICVLSCRSPCQMIVRFN